MLTDEDTAKFGKWMRTYRPYERFQRKANRNLTLTDGDMTAMVYQKPSGRWTWSVSILEGQRVSSPGKTPEAPSDEDFADEDAALDALLVYLFAFVFRVLEQ